MSDGYERNCNTYLAEVPGTLTATVYHFALHASSTPARDFGSRWVPRSYMHTSIRPVHRLSRKATRLSRVGTTCQWFVTKIAAAITAAPATMAIGIPMIGKYAPNPVNSRGPVKGRHNQTDPLPTRQHRSARLPSGRSRQPIAGDVAVGRAPAACSNGCKVTAAPAKPLTKAPSMALSRSTEAVPPVATNTFTPR